MSKIFSIFVILLFFVQQGFSQHPSVREWLSAADSAYQKGNYPAAYQFYDAALKYKLSSQDSLSVLYKFAESARQFNAFEPAEKAYQTIVDKDRNKQYPLSLYWLAVVQQQQEKYEKAELHYEQFLNQAGASNPAYQQLAEKGLTNASLAGDTAGIPRPIVPTRLGTNINDSNAEYIAEFMGEDTLVYSTLNEIYRKDTHNPPRKYTKIYTSVGGQESQPWDALNEPGKHVSNLVFNGDQSRMYYTICEYKENSVIEVRCDLYMRQREKNGTWGEKKKVAVNAADNAYTTTQPALAYDATNNREILFFVSDRPTDAADTSKDLNIWMSYINAAGEVMSGTPVNALNTNGNEAAPSFYAPTQTLYFSSTGRTPNFGGFDIYEADMTSNGWTEVKALNRPINSGYDELHFLLKDTKNGTDAYFSTNMPIDTIEKTYVDPAMKACCWDIFKVDYEVKLLVRTLLASNGNTIPLNGSTLSLYVETPTGNKLDTTFTQANGNAFLFTLLPNKKYIIVGKHPNFNYEQTATIDPIRTEYIGRDTVRKDFVFAPIKLLVNTFKMRDGAPLDSAKVTVTSNDGRSVTGTPVDENTFSFEVQHGKQYTINGERIGYYDENASADLSSATYRDSTQIERNLYFRQELEVFICNENGEPLEGARIDRKLLVDGRPTNLEVTPNDANTASVLYGYDKFDMHEKYRLIITRPSYSPKTVDLAFNQAQIIASNGKFEERICLERIPFEEIILYFDNDEPGPHTSRDVTTSTTYGQTYEAYRKRKDDFLKFYKNFTTGDPFVDSIRLDAIFNIELKDGFDNLETLSENILTLLQQGNTVEVTIEGRSSPRGNPVYNESLSSRRIDSVLKHFLSHNGGKIRPYWLNKKFKINRISLGAGEADPRAQAALRANLKVDTSISPARRRELEKQKGIYDLLSTLERKVTITRLTINGQSLSLTNYNLIKKTTK